MPEFTVHMIVSVPTVAPNRAIAVKECREHLEKAIRSQPSLAEIRAAAAFEMRADRQETGQ